MNIGKMFAKAGEKIKGILSNKKKVIAAAAVCATVAAGAFGFQANKSANATGAPRFNFLQGDVEMLRVAKTTSSTWGDPISANIGDRVAFLFYYHNGVVDSVAHHAKVRVDLPINQGTQLNATSYLWSQETAAISDTVVNGQLVGHSGATINVPTNARIQYVPGSTKWYPNGSQTPTNMPDGIISSSGLDLGDINGCWQYAGYVTFTADIYGQSNLVLDKTVAHPGDPVWHDEINANPGDSIAYHLGIRNDGDITAEGVTVKDILPSYMTYEAGTTFYYTQAHPEGVQLPNTMFTTGVSIPNLAPGDAGITYITYRTRIDSTMPTGAFALNNIAKVFMNGVQKDQDQAKVTVVCERGLVIDKKVSNGTSWVEQNTAKIGDEVHYRIIVRNTGNVAVSGVKVRDVLPVYVNYVVGSTKVDGVAVGDQIITTAGLDIGTLAAGAQKVVTLRGRIYGCPPVGGYTLTNTGYTWTSSIATISDTAITTVEVTTPLAPRNN